MGVFLPSMVIACSPLLATAEGRHRSTAHLALPSRLDNWDGQGGEYIRLTETVASSYECNVSWKQSSLKDVKHPNNVTTVTCYYYCISHFSFVLIIHKWYSSSYSHEVLCSPVFYNCMEWFPGPILGQSWIKNLYWKYISVLYYALFGWETGPIFFSWGGGELKAYLTLVVSQVSLRRAFNDQHQDSTTGLSVGLKLLLVSQQPALLEPSVQGHAWNYILR